MLWHKLIGFAVLSVVLTEFALAQSNAGVAGCRNNFTQVAGKCVLATNTYFNWYEADRHCRSLGAGLLSVQNQTQLQQIEQWMNVTVPWVIEFWTSGNSLGQKGNYFWQSTGEQARYLPWSTGQPQAASGDCLSLYGNNYTSKGYSNYRLTVRNCSYFAPHICEQQPQQYQTRICLKPGSYENAQVLA